MFSWVDALATAAAILLLGGVGAAGEHAHGYFGLGTTPTTDEVAGWAIAVRPDGKGLPPGRGSVPEGGDLYADACAACHGLFGQGEGRYPKLAGTGTLTGERPEPMVGNYWPYATTLFDYINRAMPFPSPHLLSAGEVYALTAYVLNINNIVDSDFVADKDSLPKVRMPNRDGFIWNDPRPDTHDTACMNKCRASESVKIESTAEGKNLTPRTTGPLDTAMPQ